MRTINYKALHKKIRAARRAILDAAKDVSKVQFLGTELIKERMLVTIRINYADHFPSGTVREGKFDIIL